MNTTERSIKAHEDRLAVMRAFQQGAPIESQHIDQQDRWDPCPSPGWWWDSYNYRIKPKEPRKFTVALKGALGTLFISEVNDQGKRNLLREGYEVLEVVEVIPETSCTQPNCS